MNAQNTVIVGIHGLSNKPPPDTLQDWWGQAITEGLSKNHGRDVRPEFELAYWADIRNRDPVANEEQKEPYIPAITDSFERYDPGLFDRLREIVQDKFGKGFDKAKDLLDIGEHAEGLLGVKLGDLADYYDKQDIQRQMRARLSDVLVRHRDKRILLIAHSMGSIIAYDVLRVLESAEIDIEHFVTIGSPLGLPYVAKKIRGEFGRTRAPECISRWTNLSDPGDKVAIDCNLDDEFSKSSRGTIVLDRLLHNEYVSPEGDKNNHKSYGYLRAPEVSDIIDGFLSS